MTRRPLHTPVLLACLAAALTLAVAAPASARPAKALPAAKVAVGHPVVGTAAGGGDAILVPVHYPIALKGRLAELRVALIGARGQTTHSWVLHERLNGGKERLPDRRRRFTFVHRVGLTPALSRTLRRGTRVRVLASGRLDVEGDGKAELRSRDLTTVRPLSGPQPKPVCSSVPHLRVKPGGRLSVPLPACDTERDWTARKGSHGTARVRAGRLIYIAPQGFRGSDEVELASGGVRQVARITVGTGANSRVRAIGDSVTAGFGYYGTGGAMGATEFIFDCRPAPANFNDACSSNSRSKKSKEGPVEYFLPDYGLSRNVSWVAQWANANGVTDYQNLAVSGSEPKNWAPPNGTFYPTLKKMEGENPDYVLLTLGANPMLSQMLLEPSEWWCAVVKGLPGFEKCIKEEFEKVELRTWLARVYADLLKNTSATIYVMQYHLSIPVSAVFERTVEIARANQMLNEEIAAVVGSGRTSRLRLVTPPHFNVGIELKGVYPSGPECPPADGPSVQSWITQKDLKLWHFETFCEGPETENEPDWVISTDSGIHPSVTGYTHMASEVPAAE